jgi:hypothetical protein
MLINKGFWGNVGFKKDALKIGFSILKTYISGNKWSPDDRFDVCKEQHTAKANALFPQFA